MIYAIKITAQADNDIRNVYEYSAYVITIDQAFRESNV